MTLATEAVLLVLKKGSFLTAQVLQEASACLSDTGAISEGDSCTYRLRTRCAPFGDLATSDAV